MADIISDGAFTLINLNRLIADQTYSALLSDQYMELNGIVYEDLLRSDFNSGRPYTATLGGSNITMNASHTAITGGTVNCFFLRKIGPLLTTSTMPPCIIPANWQ